MARERREVFGEAAEQYRSARPSYPGGLTGDILDYSGPVECALEIGAGTGKATAGFAAHAVAVTCLEPDPRMAAILARECADYPLVHVEIASFEEYRPAERFDLLYAAQSWHWVDEARRWDLAHAALRPGGTVALFWNWFAVVDPDLQATLFEIDHHYEADALRYTPAVRAFAEFAPEFEITDDWPSVELGGDPRFVGLENRRYRRTLGYSTPSYLGLLSSISAYRLLEDDQRQHLFEDVARVIDDRGGHFELGVVTDLFLGRTVA